MDENRMVIDHATAGAMDCNGDEGQGGDARDGDVDGDERGRMREECQGGSAVCLVSNLD